MSAYFVTGVGETIRTLKAANKIEDGTDTVIDTYRNLKNADRIPDTEVHHIVEKRFAPELGYTKTANEMLSINLPKDVHLKYTLAWRKYLPYGSKYSVQDVFRAATEIYFDDPRLMGVVLFTLTNNK